MGHPPLCRLLVAPRYSTVSSTSLKATFGRVVRLVDVGTTVRETIDGVCSGHNRLQVLASASDRRTTTQSGHQAAVRLATRMANCAGSRVRRIAAMTGLSRHLRPYRGRTTCHSANVLISDQVRNCLQAST